MVRRAPLEGGWPFSDLRAAAAFADFDAAAVFAASEAARLEAWLPQVALDGAWVLLFAALCFGFALSAEEQRRVRDAALAGLARVRAARTGLPVRGRR